MDSYAEWLLTQFAQFCLFSEVGVEVLADANACYLHDAFVSMEGSERSKNKTL